LDKKNQFRVCWFFFVVFAFLGDAASTRAQTSAQPPFRLFLSEVRPGSITTGQRCVLIFPDHRFHLESATSKRGRDISRKVYEGELSEIDWNQLSEILERKDFRELVATQLAVSPVVEDLHLIAISVWRDGKFQNMEFIDNRSRAPYDATLKSLLQWWKSFPGRKLSESKEPANKQCALEGATGDTVFAP
jgi:hypothetical protein